MLKHCQRCNKEFEAKREDARYCGATCRQASIRARDNREMSAKHRLNDIRATIIVKTILTLAL